MLLAASCRRAADLAAVVCCAGRPPAALLQSARGKRWHPQPMRHAASESEASGSGDALPAAAGDSAVAELDWSLAAPRYAQLPTPTASQAYGTVTGAGGEPVANLALYKDSIDAAQPAERHYHRMTADERTVYLAHISAVQRRRLTYDDPFTGRTVFTVAQLLLNAECCGNACRHCPYGHVNVPADTRTAVFNGAYYV